MTALPLTSDRLEFDSYSDAVESYTSRGWTDGLPIIPPTPDRVRAFLERAGLSPAEILGAEPTKARVITAEKAAVNAVMAGCLPEHFIVVVEAVRAMAEPKFNLHAVSVSTMGAAILAVVNGPIAVELGMNSGVSVFGPGNRANATIGRAIRLIQINATGAVPGELDKATLGHAGKYTWCIAEAEAVSPWEPLHVERGFSASDSTVSIFAGISPIQSGASGETPESVLGSLGDALKVTGTGQQELVVILSPETLGHISAAGWSKHQVKSYLYEVSKGGTGSGVVDGPDGVTVVVAGGAAGGATAIVPLWGGGSNSQSVTRAIETP